MVKVKIFINYRREDSAGYVGRLYDRLVPRFGKELIFYDMVQPIRKGTRFTMAIQDAIHASDLMLVVIGKLWLEMMQERMADPNNPDYVSSEIALALSQNKFVIPVLVADGKMPKYAALPKDIGDIAMRQAIKLSDDNFHKDVDGLIETIADYLTVNLDQVLQDRNAYPDLQLRLKNVTELDVYAPSAAAFLDNQNAHSIQATVLDSSGSLRILIQNPADTDVIDRVEAHEKKHVERQGMGLKRAIENTLGYYAGLGWSKNPNIQLKLLSFYPGFSLVLYNRSKPDAYASVEIHGYYNESARRRMHIDITKSRSPSWFNYWLMQFEKMWEDGEVYVPYVKSD
ncbi:MAG: toll/interleukin-1 receptor domain-containing protein [Anaerolineae bacterium]|nr:toll/interleukin-1 receptor domain-containing protein [Anaerolineae bacterium]